VAIVFDLVDDLPQAWLAASNNCSLAVGVNLQGLLSLPQRTLDFGRCFGGHAQSIFSLVEA